MAEHSTLRSFVTVICNLKTYIIQSHSSLEAVSLMFFYLSLYIKRSPSICLCHSCVRCSHAVMNYGRERWSEPVQSQVNGALIDFMLLESHGRFTPDRVMKNVVPAEFDQPLICPSIFP